MWFKEIKKFKQAPTVKLLKVPYYIKNERDSARTQRRIGGSAFESAAQLYYYHLQSAATYLVLKREVEATVLQEPPR